MSICEGELSKVDGSYRIKSPEFPETLKNLQFLDLSVTTFRGDLAFLDNLSNLKAVTLPGLSRDNVSKFKDHHKNCVIINAYEFER